MYFFKIAIPSVLPAAKLVLVLSLFVTTSIECATACDFHCNHTICGETPVEYRNMSFVMPRNLGTLESTFRTAWVHTLDLEGRGITSLLPGGLDCYFDIDPSGDLDDDDNVYRVAQTQAVSLANNLLTAIPDFGIFQSCNIVSLANNNIGSFAPRTFGNVGQGFEVFVDLHNNSITALPDNSFDGVNSSSFTVNLSDNGMLEVGEIFGGFTGYGQCYIDFSNNQLTPHALKSAVSSFTVSTASLTIVMVNNMITSVPAHLFQNVSTGTVNNIYNQIVLDLSANPITTIDVATFNGYGFLTKIVINLNNPTRGTIATPQSFVFDELVWDPAAQGKLKLGLVNTGVPMSIANAFNGTNGPQTSLELDLTFNNYTTVPSRVFHGSTATFINLSYNLITLIFPDAFNYNFRLHTLDLCANLLTVVPISLLTTVPGLVALTMWGNKIWALRSTSNNIEFPVDFADNVLVCDSYGPAITGCRCTDGSVYSEACGYGRCMTTASGCVSPMFSNTTNCSAAPYSQCLSRCPQGQYYDASALTCLKQIKCATAFQNRDKPGVFNQAYQVEDATDTSDRVCSICSVCPADYHTVACTTTSNTVCNRSEQLSSGDVASILLSVMILIVTAVVGVMYGRNQSLKRTMTQDELNMTELLLGDVTEENDRFTEVRERMEQAWSIDEADLKLNDVIGMGAFGTVFAGTWGHIPVAVKVLKVPFDDLDTVMSEDFNREVTFMQSIRHPNLLTFYGAGINERSEAYLVTELMEGGSLYRLLHDQRRQLTWGNRLSFAIDIARGMRYLHEKETLHRDLKADNCFLDNHLRVKVADFGTGKMRSKMNMSPSTNHMPIQESDHDRYHDRDHDRTGRTMTKGMGSLLWMAPEVLSGQKIMSDQGKAIDVFSFSMVMFEIWARKLPWTEIEDVGVKFLTKLVEMVCSDVRPRLPTHNSNKNNYNKYNNSNNNSNSNNNNNDDTNHDDNNNDNIINNNDDNDNDITNTNTTDSNHPPDGYCALMRMCWATVPSQRPTFALTLTRLEEMRTL